MIWTSIPSTEHAAEYVSGPYRITHDVDGYGRSACVWYCNGQWLGERLSEDALAWAQTRCAEHAASREEAA